jgi:hypothetical protein
MERLRPVRVYPYSAPFSLAESVWQIKGSLRLPVVPRYMTVYRLPDARLILYSVIAMHEEGMRALEALGTPHIMVLPHDRHQMDAPFYKARYPDIRVVAPEPAVTRSVPVDGALDELSALGVRAYVLPGTRYHEVVLELPTGSGVAVCTTELLGNFAHRPGLLGFVLEHLGPPGGGFGVNRAVRWREVSDRNAVRAWLQGLANRADVRMVLMGHAAALTADVQRNLGHAALRG